MENLSAQTTIAEVSATLKLISEQVAKALRNFEPGKSHPPVSSPQPPELDIGQTPSPPAQLPTLSGGSSVSYNKLPNPLSSIIQQLPVVDGLDVDKLMGFFRILFQLSDFPGMSDGTLLELVYPYCRGSVAERVAHTIQCLSLIHIYLYAVKET